jgi:hypothetical protein
MYKEMLLMHKGNRQTGGHQELTGESYHQWPWEHKLLEDTNLGRRKTQAEDVDPAFQTIPASAWLLSLGATLLRGKEPKKHNHYNFFPGVLKNNCYIQGRLLAHNAVERIKLWGKIWVSCSFTHVLLIPSSETIAELRESQHLSPATT